MDPIIIVLLGIGLVLFCIIALRLNAVVALLFAAIITSLLTAKEHIYNYATNKGLSPEKAEALANQALGERIAEAFGSTAGKISILIALGSIIGVALMRSGGAERIIRSFNAEARGLFNAEELASGCMEGEDRRGAERGRRLPRQDALALQHQAD